MVNNQPLRRIFIIVSTGLAFFLLSCTTKPPIKIGLSVTLSGRASASGIEAKEAGLLAVELANKAGGINGQTIELLIRDDENDPETAARIDEELYKEGVEAIVGHITSSITGAAIKVANKNRLVLISPTSSSLSFSGQDDYFFRVINEPLTKISALANYLYKVRNIRRVALIYDEVNLAFTGDWVAGFRKIFEGMGGVLLGKYGFRSDEPVSYTGILEAKELQHAEGIVSIAGPYDSAMFCQRIRQMFPDVQPVVSSWAKSQDFINYGGSSVEGVIFAETYSNIKNSEQYKEFEQDYLGRYGHEPDIIAQFTYEAMLVLFEALKKKEASESLKEAILRIRKFPGLHSEILFNEYGDVQRTVAVFAVNDGIFTEIRE